MPSSSVARATARPLNPALPFVLLALCAVATMTTACGDDFTEVPRGSITVTQVGASTGTGSRSEISFAALRPDTTADDKVFLIQNLSEEGDLEVESIEFVTESPFITSVLDLQEPACDGSTCTFDPFTLTPRQGLQLEVRYEPKTTDIGCGAAPAELGQVPDDYCAHLIIRSDDPSLPEITLIFRVPELGGTLQVCLVETNECGESLEVAFNSAAPGDGVQSKLFTVANVGANNLTVTRITETFSPEGDFSITPQDGAAPPFELEPSQPPVTFSLDFEPLVDAETRSGNVVIQADTGDSAVISVKVGEPNAPSIEVDKTELRFVNIQNPATDTQTFTITNNGGPTANPLTIDFSLDPSSTEDYSVVDDQGNPLAGPRCEIASPPASCSNPFVVSRQSSKTISVTYAPLTADSTNATLRISSNDPDNSTVEVALIASGGSASVSSDTSAMTWTDLELGASETMTVTLSNDGNADVDITGFELRNVTPAGSDSLFTVTPAETLPHTLTAGSSLSVDVSFMRPMDDEVAFERAGSLVFLHDGGETIVSLAVTYTTSP